MARTKRYISYTIQARRSAEKSYRDQKRMETEVAKQAKNAKKAYEDALRADQKERARLYIESRIAQVNLQNERLEQTIAQINTLLINALSIDSFIDLQTLKQMPRLPVFNPGALAVAESSPHPQNYIPPKPTGLQNLFPGAKEKYAQEVAKAQDLYQMHLNTYLLKEQERRIKLSEARALFEQQVKEIRQQIADQHAEIDDFQRELDACTPVAVVNYFTLVVGSSTYPDSFPQHVKIAYIPESRQLVIEYDIPTFEVIPEIGSYKYTKSKDEITETIRPLTQRKALYNSVVAQITLRTLYEVFKADRKNYLDNIVFNGYVDSIDKGTGHTMHTCLVTVRTSHDIFGKLDLSKVDPQICLKVLNASVSKSPVELAPVRPVLEFNMVDPRFIEEIDVLSELDQRPNLMELTPSEFEALITNLFQKMGLETRQTQASRDGGVDCVAFDPRPILGGKVVIQAKRYKNTVGVSAVRDLYGTMHNEGASKGILVTTSGYGKAAFDFIEGKPLELLSGSHLIYLLDQHAGIKAKIEIAESWKDPIIEY